MKISSFKKIVETYLQKLVPFSPYLFATTLILFKLPNIYILPIYSSFATTHALARIISVLLAGLCIVLSGESLVNTRWKRLLVWVGTLFFLSQSVSIIHAENITAFLSRYKDIVLGVSSCIIWYYHQEKKELILQILFITAAISSAYSSIMLFFPDIYISFIAPFIYDRHLEVVTMNMMRGRTYAETYDELVIPFLFFALSQYALKTLSWQYIFLYLAITFASFTSGWRIRILMVLFATIASFFWIHQRSKKYFFIAILLVGIVVISSHMYLVSTQGFSFVNRFLQDETVEYNTLDTRFLQIRTGFAMGASNLFGVGLGNYYDHLPAPMKYVLDNGSVSSTLQRLTSQYVHNIFALTAAESGYISLGLLIVFLGMCALDDKDTLYGRDAFRRAAVISFWTLFLYSLLNPPIPGAYQFLLWGLRGLILPKSRRD